MIKAIIFDLDGTILDTLADLKDSVNAALSQFGCPSHTQEEVRLAIGNGMRELMRNCMPRGKSDAEVDACHAAMKQHYLAHWNINTKPYDGICALLEALRDRKLPICVLSNKTEDAVCEMVPYFFPKIPFAALRGERPGVPRKPDPTAALELANILAVSPNEILFVGDSPADVNTAKNAGMISAAVLWGYRTKEELSEADYLIETPSALTELILRTN